MPSLEELVILGTKMQCEGDALQQFVSDQQARDRDEREQERSFRQEQAKLEAEKEDQAERMREEEHQRQLELLQAGNRAAPGNGHPQGDTLKRGPKLPAFDEAHDNMDAYIQRFERYAEAQKWHRDHWGANLSALLKRKTLGVFSRLPVEKALDFDELKKALLLRFEMKEEGFRKSFRMAKPEGAESFTQFAVRLQHFIERWVEISQTEKTYTKLLDLMLRDRFVHCCSPDLALFLKERIPSAIGEMVRLADQFVEARGTKASQSVNKGQKHQPSKAQGTGTADAYRQPNQYSSKERKCYNCGKPGHLSSECRAKKNGSGGKVAVITEKVGRQKRKEHKPTPKE
ncbi:uncharacterized protein LOC110449670 [Mizuhopecten yessoensis]|uniref:uncharacterized protein LOC110449670 n=1 Tax=Mizuhopecten yessoensis TaxID=6573 RepID=UPI000B45983B|nr:uncharacterized protein LOC110449670 [Mizuhopecten yessoensis]